MAMRETVRSLRAYFILSGLATLFSYSRDLFVSFQGAFTFATVFGIIGIGFSLAFLYTGFSLPGLLKSSVGRIVKLLYVSASWVVFAFLLELLAGRPSPVAVFTLVLGLLILWYLLTNVRRLAAEAQVASSAVPSGT